MTTNQLEQAVGAKWYSQLASDAKLLFFGFLRVNNAPMASKLD